MTSSPYLYWGTDSKVARTQAFMMGTKLSFRTVKRTFIVQTKNSAQKFTGVKDFKTEINRSNKHTLKSELLWSVLYCF